MPWLRAVDSSKKEISKVYALDFCTMHAVLAGDWSKRGDVEDNKNAQGTEIL